MDNAELLRRFVEDHSQEAFTELVRRNLDLVYSAALRQLGGDAHRAQEVAQAVFTDLARKAPSLSRHTALTGWLYTSTHFAAAKLRRTEQRRQAREQEASMMNELIAPAESSQNWEKLRPVLDDAMHELKASDREAVLLRYFEQRTFAEVGDHLGLGENAARMSVERALEKLSGLLARRGVHSTATALALVLSGELGATAPAGLATTVSAGALAGAASTTGLVSLAILKIMSIGKFTSLVTVAAIAATGAAYYAVHSERASVATLATMTRERDSLRSQLAAQEKRAVEQLEKANTQKLPAAVEPPPSPQPTNPAAAASKPGGPQAKVARLRDMFTLLPDQTIPEFQFLTEEDWSAVVDGPLDSVEDFLIAMSSLRDRAERHFAAKLRPALKSYVDAHGEFPQTPAQLKSLIAEPISDAIFARYKVAPASEVPNIKMREPLIITQIKRIDSDYDAFQVIGPGVGGTYRPDPDMDVFNLVAKDYMAANGGKPPRGDPISVVSQVVPYAKTPGQKASLERIIRKMSHK